MISLPRNGSELHSESLFLFARKGFCVVFCSAEWFRTEFREFASIFWFHGTEFRLVFSSEEWFGTELWEFASIFVPRNGIPSHFLFRGRVRNGIPRFSVPRNNRNSVGNNHLFRLPRNYFFVGNSQPYRRELQAMLRGWLGGGTYM
jgi:hypothetical protein